MYFEIVIPSLDMYYVEIKYSEKQFVPTMQQHSFLLKLH